MARYDESTAETVQRLADTYIVHPFSQMLRGIEGMVAGPEGEKPLSTFIGEGKRGAWYPGFLDLKGFAMPGRCAAYVNNELRDMGYDVRGNAWATSNLQPVYDGYADVMMEKPTLDAQYGQILGYNMAAADALKANFNISQLDPAQEYVVNMYSTGSPYTQQSFQEGTSGYGSHTGRLVNRDGHWYVRHNHHGLVEENPIEDLLGAGNDVGITRISTPTVKSNQKAAGGNLKPKYPDWQDLSLRERHAYIKTAVKNGLYAMPEIRQAYKEFSEGGNMSYEDWKARMIAYRPDLKNSWDSGEYDYRGFYEDNPTYAYSMLNQDSDAHFTDKYKTPLHPTFSKESYYSANNPNTKVPLWDRVRYNPHALEGGSWGGDEQTGWTYTLSPSQVAHNWNVKDTIDYLGMAEDNGVALKYPDGSLYREEDGIPLQEILPAAIITPKAEGGHLYGEGGETSSSWFPSPKIQRQISQWEGKSMTQSTVDPLSGKVVGKNASFATIATGFINSLPADIRQQVLSNPELADYLYSYAYNVGNGNFRKRVVPALQKYYAGKGSVEEIQNSMWASGDKKLRGLRLRRAAEREGVGRALSGGSHSVPATSMVTASATPSTRNVQVTATPVVVTSPSPSPSFSLPAFNEDILKGVFDGSYKEPEQLDYITPVPVVEEESAALEAEEEPSPYQNIQPLFPLYENTPAREETQPVSSYDPSVPFVVRVNKNGGRLFGFGGDKEEQQAVGMGYPIEVYHVDNAEEVPADSMPLVDTVTGEIAGYSPGFNLGTSTVTYDPLQGQLAKEQEYRNRLTLEKLNTARVNATSNDATAVKTLASRPQNEHLMPQSLQGTAVHSQWEKEHPYLTGLSYVAGAAPFAVAAAPVVVAAGDALAGSAVGQGIGTLLVNPYVDAAATAYSGADLFNKYQNGYQFGNDLGEDLMTVMEAVPVVGYAPKVAKGIESFASSGEKFNRGSRVLIQANTVPKPEDGASADTNKSFNFGIKVEDLPKYATPNSSENPLNLHIHRLQKEWQSIPTEDANGSMYFLEPVDGKETFLHFPYRKSGKSPIFKMYAYDTDKEKAVAQLTEDIAQSAVPNYTEEDLPYIRDFFKPMAEISLTEGKSPLGAYASSGNIYLKQNGLALSKPFGKIESSVSHELDHAMHIPTETPKGFDVSKFPNDYFKRKNGTELAARGSQIKDYFGLDDNQLITEDMLKYAAEHYVEDTGTDNNMTDFFNMITDWKEAAKWLSKHSTMVGLPISFGALSNN